MVKAKAVRNKRIRSRDDIAMGIFCYSFITIIAITMLYPVLNVMAVAVSSYTSYARTPWMIIPYEFDFSAFKTVFASKLIMNSYANTIIITLTGTVLTIAITVLTAYPLSRPGFKGKAFFSEMIIFTMMFSGGIIPNFLLIKYIGLYNTLTALILPGILSAFNVMLMVNFFKALPDSLIEAAKVDGASEPYVLWRIVVPLSKPVLATIALFAAVGYWNSYFSAVMYIRDQSKWPVQLVLREIVMAANTAMLNSAGNMAELDLGSIPMDSLRYASLIVVMLPIMCVYPFLQRYFTKGVMLGAVKG